MSELLTAVEVAEKLRVQPETIRGWAREGRIPAIRLSHKVVRYELEEVVRSLREHRQETTQ